MGRVIRFLGILPLLIVSSSAPVRLIPEAQEIPNWPAPPYWTPPAGRAPGVARTQAVSTASAPLPFIAITPCRQYDSRNSTPLPSGLSRAVVLSGAPCGVPTSAVAFSVNITIFNISATANGVFQVGTATDPTFAWINFPPTETQRGNAGALPVDDSDQLWVRVQMGSGLLDFVVDVNGYYDGSGTLQLSQSRRAILDQFWTPQNETVLSLTAVGYNPQLVRSDGSDLWVPSLSDSSISRVRGSDGKLLETWTGAMNPLGVLVAMGRVFVTGGTNPGQLYRIDPSQAVGAVTAVASNLGSGSFGVTFDGSRIWTANNNQGLADGGSVSIVTPATSPPWTVTTVTTGFSNPIGALYDGANVWVTDRVAGTLLKLDGSGAILQTVTVGSYPAHPIFDGANIWVPNASSNSVSVVRASSGAIVATLTGNGLSRPYSAAFDGQRVLITNSSILGSSVSLWKAADLTPLGFFATGESTGPFGACSDGVNFWITLFFTNQLARF